MKRIEDIRPVRKIKSIIENPEPVLPVEDFFTAEIQPDIDQTSDQKHLNKRRIWPWLFLFIVIISVTFFCGFELVKAKSIIVDNLYGMNSGFSALTDSLSSKDLAGIGGQVKTLNAKTADSVLILQSIGQDNITLSLLYPKGKSSKITSEIDAVRGAHLLTNSFDQVLNFSSVSDSSGTDYLSKINGYLGSFSQILGASPKKIKMAKFYSQEAQNINSSLDPKLFPTSEEKTISSLQKFSTTSNDFFNYLTNIPADLSSALTISGGKKSYLILFLNNAEIRPGGGFIGSFARLDLENGKATALDFETNIYTLDQAFVNAGNVITPPAGISSITNAWTMRDSNVYPDYATSSEKVAWFYQQESGKQVDGIISIDTTLFRNLLKVVGPIEMPQYNMTVTDENFLQNVQYQVEIGYYQNQNNWALNQPKKILADMMPKFVAAMTKNSQVESKVGSQIMKAISEKHLMVYSNMPSVEDLIDGIDLSGKIHDASGDYLYLSDANIGGVKSSLNIAETVNQNIEIDNSGTAKESLTILRKHNGSYEWPDGENRNLLRVLLPLSSRIDRPKVTPEVVSDKSSIAYWQNTKPGETTSSEVDYHRDLAVNLNANSFDYQITIQKQPGIESYDWNLYLVYPTGWKPQNVEGYDATNRQIHLNQQISKDSVFRLRFMRD